MIVTQARCSTPWKRRIPVLLALVLFVGPAGPTGPRECLAQPEPAAEDGSGRMRVLGPDGAEKPDLPLKHTDADARIAGIVATRSTP